MARAGRIPVLIELLIQDVGGSSIGVIILSVSWTGDGPAGLAALEIFVPAGLLGPQVFRLQETRPEIPSANRSRF